MNSHDRFVPAAGRKVFTAAYDPVMTVTMRQLAWRPQLAERVVAEVPVDGTVVDVGCGTGTFAIELNGMRPDIEVTGVDGDPEILNLARRKDGGGQVRWREGFATDLPLADQSSDAVVMSLLLHHLDLHAKIEAFREARRVLKPEGKLHLSDWGAPDLLTYPGFFVLRLLDGFSNTQVHADGSLAGLVGKFGFDEIQLWKRLRTIWGSLELISCASNVHLAGRPPPTDPPPNSYSV